MCQAALDYARRGWAVFPCRERDETVLIAGAERVFKAKAPYTRQGLKDASVDEAQILAWWRRWPNALIGLPAGAEWFVLDFDPRADEESGEVWTLERLKNELEAQMGCPLPRSLTAMTQSDGVHVYFRQPEGEPIRNRGNLPDHVDVRGLGGYVIAPPSVMESGARYRWLDRGDWRDEDALVAAPAELIAILRERGKGRQGAGRQAPPARRAPSIEQSVDEDVRRYARAALEGECRAIGEAGSGRRNAQLNESAYKVATLVAAGAIEGSFARAAVEGAARGNPGRDDDGQLLATIESGWSAGLDSPRDLAEIAAASRSRRERPPPRQSSRMAPPPPAPEDDGRPTSRAGGTAHDIGRKGQGDEERTRECAFMPQTDLGNLERFLKRHGDEFLYVEQWGWLAWDGRRWNRDMAVSLLGRAIQDTMRAIQAEAEFVRDSGIAEEPPIAADTAELRAHADRQKGKCDRVVKEMKDTVLLLSDTIAKWGRTSEGAGHISCISKMAEARLAARTADFDADPLLVNMANGTLLFTRPENGRPASVRLIEPRREDRISKIGTAIYDPRAGCPAYDAFLARVQPEEDMRNFLDVWAGYNMLGDASAQKMAIFYGEGANGKGVWINTKRAILGDYAWAASINTFMEADRQRKGSDASPDLAALAGRRMVYANEAEEGSKLSDGLVKELTSDEPKGGVRELMKPPFELIITFKNTIIANTKPRIGTDHGIRRRMQLVPWDVIIPDEEQDPQLKSKLVRDSSGILNRMVAGALQYLTSGLPMPETLREATQAYLDENDILGKFLALCIERVKGETIGSSAMHELFAAWQTWAQLLPASGKPWSPKYLAAQMERKGFKKRKSSSMIWDDVWAVYAPGDFVRDGKPVEDELPAPRSRASFSSPDPSSQGHDADDMPL